MDGSRHSRRQVLRAILVGGIAVYLAPLGSRAFSALFEDELLTVPDWNGRNGSLKHRVDATAKVLGKKVFARDIRARDMPHWPQQQGHALVLRVTKADRRYAGFDLTLLDRDLIPDRIVTAADLARDGLAFPNYYGDDMLLPEGQTPAYLGQAVAILIYRDFARFRFAKYKLQFNDGVVRYGEETGPLARDPWGSSRFVRIAGPTPASDDVFSPMLQGPFAPTYQNHEPVWPAPTREGDVGAQGMYHASVIAEELAHPPADWLVLRRDYVSQSADTAALEPDNANGWYDAANQELHLVVPSQSPQEVAANAAAMLAKSRIGVKRLFLHPCFTVGYGSKDHFNVPYYGLVAAIYGDGVPVRLANDRFEQFQTSLKRHQFDVRFAMAVDRKSGLMQTFQANIVANGGGRANCSVALAMAGATQSQSIYYFPKSDIAASAIASRAIDCGSARGYGAIETLTATELMIDEIAAELDLDPIDFRLRNVLKTGMKTTQGAVPDGVQRGEAVLQKAKAHPLWSGRATRKVSYDAVNPGKYYGVGFAASHRRFGTGSEASFAKVEVAPDGRIALSHTAAEIGTGTSSGQAVACVRWLGRPADDIDLAVTDWPDLPVETSADSSALSEAEQSHLAENPRWTPVYASASSASNSSYYFTHTTREAARIVFLRGLWPAALALWEARGVSTQPSPERARWSNGVLTVPGWPALELNQLAVEAHARSLVTGAIVHAFNRWRWGEADFKIDGVPMRLPLDGVAVRYGNGAYSVLDRQNVFYPPPRSINAMVSTYTVTGALAELVVDAATGRVALLRHHAIVECGNLLVPELVSGQIQGGAAAGIGLALYEYLPLYEEGPGDGTWNFNRYQLPRGSDVAVWTQTADVLEPLSDAEPPKGMAEAAGIPIVAAIVNGIAHAIDHRFRTLPVTPDQILAVIA
jgi:CO/xanthine dehydrogenase Mo-binding subunit